MTIARILMMARTVKMTRILTMTRVFDDYGDFDDEDCDYEYTIDIAHRKLLRTLHSRIIINK